MGLANFLLVCLCTAIASGIALSAIARPIPTIQQNQDAPYLLISTFLLKLSNLLVQLGESIYRGCGDSVAAIAAKLADYTAPSSSLILDSPHQHGWYPENLN
jgi:hypothetical protein